MKLKKLFAGIVAVAMMATMSFPAFAATESSNLSDGKIVLTKTYTAVNGSTQSQAEDFTFIVTAGATVNGKTVQVTGNRDLTTVPEFGTNNQLKKTVLGLAAGTDNNTGTFTIDPKEELHITRPGVYYYTVTETKTGTQGVTYAAPLTMKVTAGYAEDNANELTYWVALTRDTAETNGLFTKNNKVNQDNAFENKYEAGTLVVKKLVRGLDGDREHEFTFTIVLHGQTGTQVTYELNGDKVVDAIGEDGTLTISNVKLSNDEQFVISNIPYGVTYTISEGTEGYTATAKKDNATATLTTADNTASYTNNEGIAAASTTVEFTNSLGGTVDTGVILDNAPYILMLAVVAGGAMTLVIKKRREEE